MNDRLPGFKFEIVRRMAIKVLLFTSLLAACRSVASGPEQQNLEPETPRVLISEVLAGVEGNNNYEFIELYNTGAVPVDLQGLSVWYQLPTEEASHVVFGWDEQSYIPAKGHYLLVRSGEDIGITPDAEFAQSLNTTGGNLWLLDSEDERIDALAWGTASGKLGEGEPAPGMQNGFSLERLPGGDAGNSKDTDDNKADFSLQPIPSAQNVASSRTPGGEQPLGISIALPDQVKPGDEFSLEISIENRSSSPYRDLHIVVPLPSELDVSPLQADFTLQDDIAIWMIDSLPKGESSRAALLLDAPWAYFDLEFSNIHAELPDQSTFVFAETRRVQIEGGTIPIVVARDLIRSEVIVEGIASMYTGGYFAGSGNVKFYMEDQSDGVQVWVPSGEGSLDVPLGARVRVRGQMDLYRGARELVTSTPEDVQILSLEDPPEPLEISIQQAVHDEGELAGRLVSMQGTATRVEEFSYSYEMDLVDDAGNLITLYIDKQTDLSGEAFEAGRQYQATGILENTDDRIQLYPRIAGDLQEVFPPVVRIETDAPITVNRNQDFEITFKIYNNTLEPKSDLELWFEMPPEIQLIRTQEHAETADHEIRWQLPEIPPHGEAIERSATFRTGTTQASVRLEDFGILSPSGVEFEPDSPLQIFLGETVPIWAIQWEGDSSPFKLRELETSGVVTGVFPELGGFWIQNLDPDNNPSTSEGLFVASGELDLDPEIGQLVRVGGQVREISSQTQLLLDEADAFQVLSTSVNLPEPVELDPPRETEEAQRYFEQYEGMLVQVNQPATVVGPSTHYGEYVLVLAKHETLRIFHGEETGWLIHVDDGSEITHEDRSTLPYALSVGDQVFAVEGPLAYTYGNYKIEPTSTPQYQNQPVSLPSLDLPEERLISVMTWNVENLFDILDPHPSSPPRPRKADYELDLTKIANTILAADTPDIVALQEVEHIGILEDLSGHPLLSDYEYAPYLIEGTDSRGIDVGYLVRSDRLQVLDVRQYPAPEGLTSRPPLVLHLQREQNGTSREIYVLNNHFTSLAGGEAATEPRRVAQAAWNVSVVQQIRAASPQADVIVLGDLNSFYDSAPLDTLRQAGLHHVYEWLPELEEYTYNFEGVSQSLDHIFVSPSLFDGISRVTVMHADADYALPSPQDESPLHQSDHDPVITVINP
jgi:predicted extracellular nuclease